MKKLLLLTFLVATMCLYGPAAWSIQDYAFNLTDNPNDIPTPQCDFTNGFNLLSASGIASETNDAISVTIVVDGTVGNGNADPDSSNLPPGDWCTDNDPNADCGDDPSDMCPYDDAPGGPGTQLDDEAYTIQICQPGVSGSGCSSPSIAEIIFQSSDNASGNNVFSNTAGVTVTPTNIALSAGFGKQFTVTLHGLSTASGLDYRTQWGIKIIAGSEVDGPGEDQAGTVVSPPAPPALSCTKTFNTSSAEPGQEITATVTASNSGASDTLVNVVDTLDVGFSYVAGSSSIGEPSIVGQVLTWSNLNLPAGGNLNITYRLNVDALEEGETICNNVFVNSVDFPGVSAGPCLACVTRPIVQKEPVPGMTEFTMALTALLMILATMFFIRRRRTHSK
jgi:uncharacterized repeat protein (TIGR01451 family)